MPTHKDYIEIISENSKEDPKAVETFLGELRNGLDFAAVSPSNPVKGAVSVAYTLAEPGKLQEDCWLTDIDVACRTVPEAATFSLVMVCKLIIKAGPDDRLIYSDLLSNSVKRRLAVQTELEAGAPFHVIVHLDDQLPAIEALSLKVSFTTKTA